MFGQAIADDYLNIGFTAYRLSYMFLMINRASYPGSPRQNQPQSLGIADTSVLSSLRLAALQ